MVLKNEDREITLKISPAKAEMIARLLEFVADCPEDSMLEQLDPDGKWSWAELTAALFYRASQQPNDREPLMIGDDRAAWKRFIFDTTTGTTYLVLPDVPDKEENLIRFSVTDRPTRKG